MKQQEKFASKVRKIVKKNKEKVQQQEQQAKANEGQQQENTAERQVNVAVISGNLNQGLETFSVQGSVAREQVELTPEQMKQLEEDLIPKERENVQTVETPKRGVATLNMDDKDVEPSR